MLRNSCKRLDTKLIREVSTQLFIKIESVSLKRVQVESNVETFGYKKRNSYTLTLILSKTKGSISPNNYIVNGIILI